MKKLILLSLIVLMSVPMFAQENTSNEKTRDSFLYAEILGYSKFLSTKVSVTIDFGQNTTLFEDTRLRDENGKVISFNSMVDAMNWMGAQGWEFVQAYTITEGQQNVYHWLLKLNLKYLTPEQVQEITSKFKTKRSK
ncbi:hypothetical protein SDC9_80215 [bioreactor metagenome]|uniref:Uncharacterized protein n=1 Tax=bioreactor metagenome TaxID=1076179 RepID=A0A644Z013_9ZZZZ